MPASYERHMFLHMSTRSAHAILKQLALLAETMYTADLQHQSAGSCGDCHGVYPGNKE